MSFREYVVGFYFNPERTQVALIHKLRPEWQAGRLNGIGGKKENNETFPQAMNREFGEEAGVVDIAWRHFAVLKGRGKDGYTWTVCFFTATARGVADLFVRSMTDEIVGWYDVDALPETVLPNLRWLIPLALDKDALTTFVYEHPDLVIADHPDNVS